MLLDVDPPAAHASERALSAQWKAVLGCGVVRPAHGFQSAGLHDANVDAERTVAALRTLLKPRDKGGYACDAEAAEVLASKLLAHIDSMPVPDGVRRGVRDAVEKALRKHITGAGDAGPSGSGGAGSGGGAARKRKR